MIQYIIIAAVCVAAAVGVAVAAVSIHRTHCTICARNREAESGSVAIGIMSQ